MTERFWLLKHCGLFERLSAEQLQRLEGRSRTRDYRRGNPVYLPADEASGVLLLTKGRVKICGFSADGKQSILSFINPGELFGELSIFDESPREEYAEAVDDSVIVLIPRDVMLRLMEECPDLTLGVTRLIGLRRRRIERRLKYLLFRSNRERLVHLLLELAEQYGRRDGDGVSIELKLSHQDLANIIGSTRETVTVLLGELQSEGIVKLARRKIVLTRMERLAAEVEAEMPKITPRPASPPPPATWQPGSETTR
jgi:CRP/FNR family cyclic AMP-dependent transcriptional regulator